MMRFGWLWLGAGVANLGDGVVITTLPLIALAAGAGPGEVALVGTFATIAWPLLGLHAGWVVDRMAVPRLLVGVNALRGFAFAALAVVVAAHGPVVPAVLAAALAYGVAETLVDTALVAAVPAVVPAAGLTRANGRLEATVNVTNQFLGPPLAGVLVGIASAVSAATGSILYLLSGAAALALASGWHGAPAPGPREGDPPRHRVRDGLVFLWSHAVQRRLTVLTAVMNLVWGMWLAVFVVHAVSPGPLGLTPAGYGWLLTAMAAGGLVASLVTSGLQRRLGDGILLFVDCLGTIGLVLPAALGAPLWVVAAGIVLAGAGASIWRIIVAVIRQRTTPNPLIGRVYAASRVISWGALPLGSALAGAAASLIGVQGALAIASVIAVAAAVAYLPVWRTLGREPT